jgi:UrcA family protein
MTKLLILAALAAAPLAQPAFAQPAPAPAPRTALVAHSDLDLATERGARTLDRRIWRAVVAVCGTAPDYDLEGKNEVRQCRRDTRVVASAEAEQVIADAARVRPIPVTTRTK